MRTEFISIREILSEVYRQGGDIVKDITEDDVIMETSELIGVVGMPALFINKTAELEVKKYRTALPCDLYDVNQVRCLNDNRTLNKSTDMFDIRTGKTNVNTYTIQHNILVTSFEEGIVELSYKAFMLDEYGAPMIPNDKTFTRALVSYIIYKRVYNEYINGKIPNERLMERVESTYEFNIAQASRRFEQPSYDECENVKRMMNSFIFRDHANDLGYRNIGDENVYPH